MTTALGHEMKAKPGNTVTLVSYGSQKLQNKYIHTYVHTYIYIIYIHMININTYIYIYATCYAYWIYRGHITKSCAFRRIVNEILLL